MEWAVLQQICANFKKVQKSLLLIAFIFSCLVSLGQATLKGKVTTSDGIPASGVNVLLKDARKGVATNEEGLFILKNLKPGTHLLEISFVGAKTINRVVELKDAGMTEILVELAEASTDLEEVVVNGKKTMNNTSVSVGKFQASPRELPQSVSVIGQQVIADQQMGRLSDVMKNVNGVAIGTARGSVTETFYARGYSLGSNNILKNGSRTNTGSMPEASTLESVEVLKGSAALLYGGVSGGAVVNLVTKQPKFHHGGEVMLRVGSYDLYKPTIDLYGPLSQKLAYRLVGTYEKAGSFRDGVHSKRSYLNPSLLYKLSDKTTLRLLGDYLATDFTPDFGLGSVDGKIPSEDMIPRNRFFNTVWAYNKIKQLTSSFEVEHKISEHWKVNFIGSYQQYNRNYFGTERIQAAANGDWSRPLTRTKQEEDYYTAQMNLTGDFATGKINHKILLGVDGDQNTTVNTQFRITGGTAYDKINLLDPAKFTPRTDMPVTTDTATSQAPSYRFGVYLQDMVAITPKLRLLAGIRWSYQETTKTTVNYLLKDSVAFGGTPRTDKAFSPKVGLVYLPLKTTSVFISYSNNFVVNSGVDINNQALKPSIIDQFEAGVKNDFFDGKLSANFSVYRIINNDLAQMAELDANGNVNSNTNIKEFTGQTTSDGFEVDITASLSKNIYFIGGYSNNYMRYTRTSGASNSFVTGERLVNNTAQTANGTVFYTFSGTPLKGLKIGASTFYTGKRLAGWNNTQANKASNVNRNIQLGDFTTFDVSLGYSFRKLSLLAKLSNITDELDYIVHENYSVNPIAPRQFSTTLSYKF